MYVCTGVVKIMETARIFDHNFVTPIKPLNVCIFRFFD